MAFCLENGKKDICVQATESVDYYNDQDLIATMYLPALASRVRDAASCVKEVERGPALLCTYERMN